MTIQLKRSSRGLSAGILLVTLLASSAAAQQSRERMIKINSSPNEPLKIMAVRVNGVQIEPGRPFQAEDDWIRRLSLTVTNISKKPICFIHIQLHLPRTGDDVGEPASDALMSSCNPVNVVKAQPLMPGKRMELVFKDSDYEAHEALLERNGYSPSVSNLELKVYEIEFFGEKNRKWSNGQMLEQDPNHPGDWHPLKPRPNSRRKGA